MAIEISSRTGTERTEAHERFLDEHRRIWNEAAGVRGFGGNLSPAAR